MAASTRTVAKDKAPIKVTPKTPAKTRRRTKQPKFLPWKQLTIIVTDETGANMTIMDHVEIHDAVINFWNDIQEITSNPAMAAALAGAPAEVLAGLPGESVAYMDLGTEIELTYKVRFHTVGKGIGEFRPRFGG